MHLKTRRAAAAILATLGLSIAALAAPALAHGEAAPPSRSQPPWAPDGRSVAFLERNDGQTDIRIYDLDEGKARTVRTDVGHFGNPGFAPSGDALIFPLGAKDGNGPWRVMALDLATGDERELVRSENRIMHAQWSPDGRFVSYSQFEGAAMSSPNDIMLLDIESGEIQRITETPAAAEFHPKWRADAAALIFDRSDAEALRIMQFEIASGAEAELARIARPEMGGAPAYAPDGKAAVFVRSRGAQDGLWIVDVETGDARLLFANGDTRGSGGAVFSPAGDQLVFHFAEDEAFDLYLINRDGSGLSLLMDN